MLRFTRLLALGLAACTYAVPAAAQEYNCVPFAPYDGLPVAAAKLNNLNESVGTVRPGGTESRAAVFRADGTVKYVHTTWSKGAHINDAGNAVFTLLGGGGTGVGLAYYRSSSNTAEVLALPDVPSSSVSTGGIDAADTVYGTMHTSDGRRVPFKVEGGVPADLSPVLGSASIGGVSPTGGLTGGKAARQTERAFRYRPAARRSTDLSRILGEGLSSFGQAINTSQTVGGRWQPGPDGRTTGFIVAGQAVHNDVRFSTTDGYSEVFAINQQGEAVGHSAAFPGAEGAPFLWRAGALTLLTCPGRMVGRPVDINDQGVILDRFGVLLVPAN